MHQLSEHFLFICNEQRHAPAPRLLHFVFLHAQTRLAKAKQPPALSIYFFRELLGNSPDQALQKKVGGLGKGIFIPGLS